MTNTIPNLSQRQIMLSFAYLAYTGELLTTPDPIETINTNILAAMPKIPPLAVSPWKIVWGPAVYTVPGALNQSNLMFVAQNIADPSQYAVAIRGTNFKSALNWMMEDFDVLQTMPWPLGTTGTPKGMISESASIDMNILLGMLGEGPYGVQMTLETFLANAVTNGNTGPAPINVCITGHSLGGMLASTMALHLADNQSAWDSTANSTVACITFAAPTAGDASFARYSDSTFASMIAPPGWDSSLATTCDAVRCDLDAAPLFYSWANVSNCAASNPSSVLFSLYGSSLDFGNLTWGEKLMWTAFNTHVLPMFAKALTAQNYSQVVSEAPRLTGTFQPLDQLVPPVDVTSEGNNTMQQYLIAFAEEAAFQHSNSYPSSGLLNVPALLDATVIVRGDPTTPVGR